MNAFVPSSSPASSWWCAKEEEEEEEEDGRDQALCITEIRIVQLSGVRILTETVTRYGSDGSTVHGALFPGSCIISIRVTLRLLFFCL